MQIPLLLLSPLLFPPSFLSSFLSFLFCSSSCFPSSQLPLSFLSASSISTFVPHPSVLSPPPPSLLLLFPFSFHSSFPLSSPSSLFLILLYCLLLCFLPQSSHLFSLSLFPPSSFTSSSPSFHFLLPPCSRSFYLVFFS